MQRYFVRDDAMNLDALEVVIDGDDARHIAKVTRRESGDTFVCCNERGDCYLARIKQIGQGKVICDLEEEWNEDRELPVSVIVAQSLPKSDKFEWVIQKGTELGAARFVPFVSSRSIVRLDGAKEQRRLDRWRKIAKEAAEQSHRSRIPSVDSVLSWADALRLSQEADLALLAYENERETSLYERLKKLPPGKTVLLMFGPEGGFSEQEVEEAKASGFRSVTLGKRVLRTETAPIFGLSCVSFYYEQIK